MLANPLIEDILAGFAQLAGESFTHRELMPYAHTRSSDVIEYSEMLEIERGGFFVSSRKEREIAQDRDIQTLSDRVEQRRKGFEGKKATIKRVAASAG